MPVEPGVKRLIAFVDGQNLFHAAKKAFGSRFPDYNPKALAERVCSDRGWTLSQTCFYTGIPDRTDNAFWNHFWTASTPTTTGQNRNVTKPDCLMLS